MQHFPGMKFQLDENFRLRSLSGPVDEITGYRKEDIPSEKMDWLEMIVPEDRNLVFENREKLKSNTSFVIENEFRIRRKNGEVKWVREITQRVSDNQQLQ